MTQNKPSVQANFVASVFGGILVLWCQSRWLCDPDVVVAMAWEDMQGFKCYVKQGREGVGMLFPGIRIRVDQDEESELERRGREAPAMRRSKGVKMDAIEKRMQRNDASECKTTGR